MFPATLLPTYRTCPPTGSDGARLHVEGVRARVMTTAAAAAKAKFGTTEAEFNAVAELLGTDADVDEDFCPTCLEAYTDGGSKWGGVGPAKGTPAPPAAPDCTS